MSDIPTPSVSLPEGTVMRASTPKGRWFLRAAKGTLLGVLFLLPLLFLPYTQDPRFVKTTFVEIAAILAGLFWIFSVITTRRLRYVRSPMNIGVVLFMVTLLASLGFSASRWTSFWGNDPTGEKVSTFLALAVLSFVLAATFVRRDVTRAAMALFASISLISLFTLFTFASILSSGAVPEWLNMNPVGPNASVLGIVLGFGFVLSFVFFLAHRFVSGDAVSPRWFRWFGLATAILSGVAILVLGFHREVIDQAGAAGLMGFREFWLALAACAVLGVVGAFVRARGTSATPQERPISETGVVVLILLALASVFFAFKDLPDPEPVGARFALLFQRPIEAAPTHQATFAIGEKTIRANPVFGFGPANFAIAYNQFRDAEELNQTPFWALRFSHGSSYAATLLSTFGGLGVFAFLVFVVSILAFLFRGLRRISPPDPLRFALAVAVCFGIALWFLYPSNLTVTAFVFLSLGMFAVTAVEPAYAGATGESSRLRVAERSVSLDASVFNFAMPLTAVFAVIATLIGLYSLTTQYAAEVYFLRAARALAVGNIDSARIFLDRAITLNRTDDAYYQGRTQVAISAIQRLVNEAGTNPSEDLLAKFQREFQAGAVAGQQSTLLNPHNPQNWFILGQLNELVVPLSVTGAIEAADKNYLRATEEDPTNPDIPYARARLPLAEADMLTLQIGQTRSGDERSRLEALRKQALEKARSFLADDALRLKSDYAAAHFLLAQIAIREDNLSEAIRNTENTARIAPGDIGVLFQLGVLYYRAERLDDAKAVFNETVRQNDNYSNARYFLGLIWDRQGDPDAALSQFQKIAALNPENEEIKLIIANISAGKPALTGIVPPLPAPENRKEPPVPESSKSPKSLDRK